MLNGRLKMGAERMAQSFKKYATGNTDGTEAALARLLLSCHSKTMHSVQAVADAKPEKPVFVFRPHTLSKAIRYFQTGLQAKHLYAVKTNPEPHVIHLLKNHRVRSYDVASLAEIKLIDRLIPHAELFFMHPVKSPEAIEKAYFHYGVKHFSLDSFDELEKIRHKTNFAKDLHLHLRLAIPNQFSEMTLTKKFGIHPGAAPTLLQAMSQHATKIGISFHVGSQCMNPLAYQIAMRLAEEVMRASAIPVHSLNVGGGFPSIYPNLCPPALAEYFQIIHTEFHKLRRDFPDLQLFSEPGRAIAAESTSLIVRVELRKENYLYINDGTYGSLFDAGIPGFIFPTRLLRNSTDHSLLPFHFYGPTCDSLDFMPGPFHLPPGVKAGDYLEIGQLGAYGKTLATHFNGFKHEEKIISVNDEPLISMYHDSVTEISALATPTYCFN